MELAGKWNSALGRAAEVVTPLHETLPLSGMVAIGVIIAAASVLG
jgi:hypothetical protein